MNLLDTLKAPAGITLMALLLTLAATGDRPDPTAMTAYEAASVLLTAVDEVGDCPLNCESSMCPGEEHSTVTATGGLADGELHEECWDTGTCEDWHECDPSFNEDEVAHVDLDRLEQLLPQLDGAALESLELAHARLALNLERRAIQVIGCDDATVILSMRMTDHQQAQISRPLN